METTEKISLGKSILLFCIALVLFFCTVPFGFCYAMIRQTLVKKLDALSIYFIEVAIALDIAGNIMMQHVLNDALLIKNEQTYYFGNKKETISSVIGKNSLSGTLNGAGKLLNRCLDFLDNNHSLDSIVYDLRKL